MKRTVLPSDAARNAARLCFFKKKQLQTVLFRTDMEQVLTGSGSAFPCNKISSWDVLYKGWFTPPTTLHRLTVHLWQSDNQQRERRYICNGAWHGGKLPCPVLFSSPTNENLYWLCIVKSYLSIFAIIPYLFDDTNIIMGCPFEIFRIDRMMDVVKNSRFSCSSKIALIHMFFINMNIDNFETY